MDEPLLRLYGLRQWRGGGRRATGRNGFSQEFWESFEALLSSLLLDLSAEVNPGRANQLFSIALMRFENSSKLWSPLIISPLMKKVGVDVTFSTSAAYFWSAAILSSRA